MNTVKKCTSRADDLVCQTRFDISTEDCIHCGENIYTRDGHAKAYIMEDIFEEHPRKCIIVQQVNCRGVMGSGLAKVIRKRYPRVYEQYRTEYELGLLELGHVSYVEVGKDILVANICGQDSYGRNKMHTDYDALSNGLLDVKDMADKAGLDVLIPYKIGCGLGGGSWVVVSAMINEIFFHRKGDGLNGSE